MTTYTTGIRVGPKCRYATYASREPECHVTDYIQQDKHKQSKTVLNYYWQIETSMNYNENALQPFKALQTVPELLHTERVTRHQLDSL